MLKFNIQTMVVTRCSA